MDIVNQELVSIITPVYNSEEYINATYESIRNQTYTNWEWIVIDDNSQDKSHDIISKLQKKDKRIKIVKNLRNYKQAKCRNLGLKIASGNYITFIDSDDLWKNEFLEKQLKLLENKKCDVVFSSYTRIDETLKKNLGIYRVPNKITYHDLLKTNYMSCLTVMFKRDKLKNIYFDEKLIMHEDYVFWLALLKKVNFAYANQDALAFYRIRSKSVSRNKIKNLFYMYFVYRQILKFNIIKSIYYLYYYIIKGIKKNKNILFS